MPESCWGCHTYDEHVTSKDVYHIHPWEVDGYGEAINVMASHQPAWLCAECSQLIETFIVGDDPHWTDEQILNEYPEGDYFTGDNGYEMMHDLHNQCERAREVIAAATIAHEDASDDAIDS
jgi:hypothetical protein